MYEAQIARDFATAPAVGVLLCRDIAGTVLCFAVLRLPDVLTTYEWTETMSTYPLEKLRQDTADDNDDNRADSDDELDDWGDDLNVIWKARSKFQIAVDIKLLKYEHWIVGCKELP